MKSILKIFTICCLIAFLSSCGDREKVFKGVSRAIYEQSNQYEKMKKNDPFPEPGKHEPPSYDQYERERQEMKKDKNKYRQIPQQTLKWNVDSM